MKDAVRLSHELGDKLCDVLSTEGELVTKWIAVAEVIDASGQRWLRTFWPEGAVPWDSIGILQVALDDLRTSPIWEMKGDEGE